MALAQPLGETRFLWLCIEFGVVASGCVFGSRGGYAKMLSAPADRYMGLVTFPLRPSGSLP